MRMHRIWRFTCTRTTTLSPTCTSTTTSSYRLSPSAWRGRARDRCLPAAAMGEATSARRAPFYPQSTSGTSTTSSRSSPSSPWAAWTSPAKRPKNARPRAPLTYHSSTAATPPLSCRSAGTPSTLSTSPAAARTPPSSAGTLKPARACKPFATTPTRFKASHGTRRSAGGCSRRVLIKWPGWPTRGRPTALSRPRWARTWRSASGDRAAITSLWRRWRMAKWWRLTHGRGGVCRCGV
mmetsp:Transcript_17024/g.41801  ORF Transcript_17024/g.41801 Transcript_17024/m.41801 type:complete len:237 (+) Transcript_17024:106-816(+)